MKKIFLSSLTIVSLFVTACTSDYKTPPQIMGNSKPPLHLNVAKIDYILGVDPTFENKYRKSEPYPELSQNLQSWMERTFVNRGLKGSLLVTVEQASIKETSIPKKHHGIKGVFTYDPSERYDGTLSVRLEVRDEQGVSKASTLTTVTHSMTVLENISLEKRQKKIAELAQTLLEELDGRLRENMNEHLGAYITF